MRYSFTATRRMTVDGALRIFQRLTSLGGATEITTGGAPGGDQMIACTALGLFPDALHRLVLPDEEWVDLEFVEHFTRLSKGNAEIHMTGLHPLKRNAVILDHGERLEAFPETALEVQRSGTWATVRLARKRNMPVTITPLGGE